MLHGKNALTILSDRQKGLVQSVDGQFLNSAHGYCLKHFEDNLRKYFKHPELKTYLWQAARVKTEAEFNDTILSMRQIDNGAVE